MDIRFTAVVSVEVVGDWNTRSSGVQVRMRDF